MKWLSDVFKVFKFLRFILTDKTDEPESKPDNVISIEAAPPRVPVEEPQEEEVKPVAPPSMPPIIKRYIGDSQYYKEDTKKSQIVIHHTASGATGPDDGAANDITFWRSDKRRVATHFIISRNGGIYQLFDLAHWAHHIGLEDPRNRGLNMKSVGIELDSWGQLSADKDRGGLQSWVGTPVDREDSVFYPNSFRGYKIFERYTGAQLASLSLLLAWLCHELDIPSDYKDPFGVSEQAKDGESGIWGHVSYRRDKVDPHPQNELIYTLQNI